MVAEQGYPFVRLEKRQTMQDKRPVIDENKRIVDENKLSNHGCHGGYGHEDFRSTAHENCQNRLHMDHQTQYRKRMYADHKIKHMKRLRRFYGSKPGECCDNLHLRHNYRRYHRFFVISPLFILVMITVLFFGSRGDIPKESYNIILLVTLIFGLKEIVGLLLSRRIYEHILRPVEDLKRGFYEVSHGNYGVEVKPGLAPEISELIFAFNQMSLQLKASEIEKQKYEENRKELIASISHDLKTPITSINGFVDGILEGVADSPEKQEAYVKIIQQNARYLNRLIDDLLLYSKLDLHKLNFVCSSLSFGDYVEELFRELELEHEENGINMKLTSDLATQIHLEIDPKLMTRAIRNIVSNAISYGKKENANIEFLLKSKTSKVNDETKHWICLDIKDNGPGIAPEQLERIFERFYRGDNARTMASGSSGLGLAIAKEIVEAHGGRIWVESVLDKGTTIGIELPIMTDERWQ